ncbi:replication factor A protein, partial [Trifolium medium]|nr:replication factor A protein [Trifolium medium]
PGRTSWRFKVRVARIWEVTAYLKPDQVNSVEMVLVDSKVRFSVRRRSRKDFSDGVC